MSTKTLLSLFQGEIRVCTTMHEISREVADRYGLTLQELRGVARARQIAWPRQEAFARIYATGRFSLPQIARYFGDRDHTTVLHGIRAHNARREAAQQARAA